MQLPLCHPVPKKGERSIKKEKASVVQKETATTTNVGGDDCDDNKVVCVLHRMTKKRRVNDVDDVEVIEKVAEILDGQRAVSRVAPDLQLAPDL